ncbi:MAG TPA: helix-turn-helix transcriptional regulator [Thermoanaerobaculia bacterium]|nr:helix-turn-helix transcriptional regulator [Thermoanaerobaculia bacterium]
MTSSMPAARFGQSLRRRRRLAELSQKELAELTQLGHMDISAIERGQRVPRLDTIVKLAAGVEATTCDLLAGLRWRPGHFHYVEGGFYVEEGPASDTERVER